MRREGDWRLGSDMSGDTVVPAKLAWDLGTLEIRTWGVETALRPIIRNITSLVNTKTRRQRRKGCSKRSASLVMAVEVATSNFVEKGEIIARENAEARADIEAVVADIRVHGASLVEASRDFARDPCSSVRRGQVVRAAQELLAAVTRLLILADMLDVHLLIIKVEAARRDLEFLASVTSQKQLMEAMRRLESSVALLSQLAHTRQREVKDPVLRDGLAAARATLVRGSPQLLSSANVAVRYPELAQARHNRDTLHRQLCAALDTIHSIASGQHQPPGDTRAGAAAEDTLLQLLTRVRDCCRNNSTTCLTEAETRTEIEDKVDIANISNALHPVCT